MEVWLNLQSGMTKNPYKWKIKFSKENIVKKIHEKYMIINKMK